jgi:hypothetical protein
LLLSHRPVLIILMGTPLLLGLFVFGSRSAMVITLGILAFWFIIRFFRDFIGFRLSYRSMILGIALIFSVPLLLTGAISGLGLGRRIFETFYWDTSAQSRLLAFMVFQHVSWSELLFGMSPARITEILVFLKATTLLTDIENFWILLLLQFGGTAFLFFVVAFIGVAWHLLRQAPTPMRLMFLVFLTLASSNNSLATKSQDLALTLAMMVAGLAISGKDAERFSPP